jgi:hypothetical protein
MPAGGDHVTLTPTACSQPSILTNVAAHADNTIDPADCVSALVQRCAIHISLYVIQIRAVAKTGAVLSLYYFCLRREKKSGLSQDIP